MEKLARGQDQRTRAESKDTQNISTTPATLPGLRRIPRPALRRESRAGAASQESYYIQAEATRPGRAVRVALGEHARGVGAQEGKNAMLTIKAFRSKQAVNRYIKFQGWTTRQSQPRMFRWPEHEWANDRGNVAVVKVGEDPGGALYVFEDGSIRNGSMHGLES